MQEFQTNKANLTQARLQETPVHTLGDGEVRVKVDRFAFTANNITYAVMGDQLRYWQFFPPNGDEPEKWGIIPVWGFGDVVESNSDQNWVSGTGYRRSQDTTILRNLQWLRE